MAEQNVNQEARKKVAYRMMLPDQVRDNIIDHSDMVECVSAFCEIMDMRLVRCVYEQKDLYVLVDNTDDSPVMAGTLQELHYMVHGYNACRMTVRERIKELMKSQSKAYLN